MKKTLIALLFLSVFQSFAIECTTRDIPKLVEGTNVYFSEAHRFCKRTNFLITKEIVNLVTPETEATFDNLVHSYDNYGMEQTIKTQVILTESDMRYHMLIEAIDTFGFKAVSCAHNKAKESFLNSFYLELFSCK